MKTLQALKRAADRMVYNSHYRHIDLIGEANYIKAKEDEGASSGAASGFFVGLIVGLCILALMALTEAALGVLGVLIAVGSAIIGSTIGASQGRTVGRSRGMAEVEAKRAKQAEWRRHGHPVRDIAVSVVDDAVGFFTGNSWVAGRKTRVRAPIRIGGQRIVAIGAICPVDQALITRGQRYIQCPSCRTPHHERCWTELDGCGYCGRAGY